MSHYVEIITGHVQDRLVHIFHVLLSGPSVSLTSRKQLHMLLCAKRGQHMRLTVCSVSHRLANGMLTHCI